MVRRQRRDVRKEEGLKLGALRRAQPGDGVEAAHDGLDERRAVDEGGDG